MWRVRGSWSLWFSRFISRERNNSPHTAGLYIDILLLVINVITSNDWHVILEASATHSAWIPVCIQFIILYLFLLPMQGCGWLCSDCGYCFYIHRKIPIKNQSLQMVSMLCSYLFWNIYSCCSLFTLHSWFDYSIWLRCRGRPWHMLHCGDGRGGHLRDDKIGGIGKSNKK